MVFSNFELHCLHEKDICLLAAVFNSIMATGQWPDELCDGIVALTAKAEQPQVPKDGRPITILSTIFRLFGKIFRAKSVIIIYRICQHPFLGASQAAHLVMQLGNWLPKLRKLWPLTPPFLVFPWTFQRHTPSAPHANGGQNRMAPSFDEGL